ncbi:hypothetical protein N9917_01510 [Deltaproteobacteria bacterium]|nr:hypothetical protein [Deltaproteobacteria bacterium]
MKAIEIQTKGKKATVLHCTHAGEWPPAHTRLDESFESQRARNFITEVKYQQLLVWKKNCGLAKMDESKCSTCPLALREEGGKLVTHAPDVTTSSKPYFARSKRNV